MERLPINAPLAQNLKFKIVNRFFPAHHAHWDLFSKWNNVDETHGWTIQSLFFPQRSLRTVAGHIRSSMVLL